MDKEYTVTRVSEQEPRPWPKEAPTVWYHKVMVEGHDRPISVGKKQKGGVKVGDTIYGTITSDPGRPEDKFKSGSKPFGGSASATKGTYQPKDEAAIKAMWAIGQAIQISTSKDDSTDWRVIEQDAVRIFKMVDGVKYSNNVPDEKPPVDESF